MGVEGDKGPGGLPSHLCGECGLRSFQIMAGALDGQAVESKLLSYEGVTGGHGLGDLTVKLRPLRGVAVRAVIS